jgi:hypothetical protein
MVMEIFTHNQEGFPQTCDRSETITMDSLANQEQVGNTFQMIPNLVDIVQIFCAGFISIVKNDSQQYSVFGFNASYLPEMGYPLLLNKKTGETRSSFLVENTLSFWMMKDF